MANMLPKNTINPKSQEAWQTSPRVKEAQVIKTSDKEKNLQEKKDSKNNDDVRFLIVKQNSRTTSFKY